MHIRQDLDVYLGRRGGRVPHPSTGDPRRDSAHVGVASPLHFEGFTTMRALLTLLVLAFAASTALADGKPISLSAEDVTAKLKPYSDTIEHCYLDHTTDVYGAGKLSVELTVTRKGVLETVAIKTPGLTTKVGIAVSSCIVDALDGLTFPERRAQTTATLPYFFQRTAAPDAGPQLSCWKAEGCPVVAATPHHTKKQNRYARVAHHGRSRARLSVSR
jgi:hypothetical protein